MQDLAGNWKAQRQPIPNQTTGGRPAPGTEGENRDDYWPLVDISPDGDYEFKGDDWNEMSFTCEVLKKEGYVSDFEVKSEGRPQLRVVTKFADKTPAITGLKRVSRPGLRRYVGADDIPRVLGGMGISILSTPRGVLSGREARRHKVGGELLAYVW